MNNEAVKVLNIHWNGGEFQVGIDQTPSRRRDQRLQIGGIGKFSKPDFEDTLSTEIV